MTKQDPLEMLLEDHKKVQTLFNDFNKSEDEAARQDIVNQVCAELTLHAQLEEEVFYPAVRKVIDNEDLMDKATVEHAAAKHLIHELEAMQPSDALYKAKFTVLGEHVNHHIEEEQEQLFPKVKKANINLEALGREMVDYKQELMQLKVQETYPNMSEEELGNTTALLMDLQHPEIWNQANEELDGVTEEAIPAAILGVVARCTLGSMTSLAIDELYSLIIKGQIASAEDRIQSAIVGCISGGLLPAPVRWAVKKFGTKIVAAAIVVGIKLRQICIPRCL